MTKREFFEAVVKAEISEEMTTQAQEYIKALNKTNEARKAKKTAEQSAVDEVVLSMLTAEPQKAKAISDKTPYTVSKVVASCKRLAEEGKAVINTETHGSRNISWYALAPADEAEAE